MRDLQPAGCLLRRTDLTQDPAGAIAAGENQQEFNRSTLVKPSSSSTARTPTNRFEVVATWILALSALAIAILLALRVFGGGPTDSTLQLGSPSPQLESVGAFSLELADSTAGVRIVEFVDLQCTACAHYHKSVLAPLLKEPRFTAVSLKLVHFPLDVHPLARDAALASECAREQNRMGEFVELALHNQRSFGPSAWTRIASESGVADTVQFGECVRTARYASRVAEGERLALAVGAKGTPTLALNGRVFNRLPRLDELKEHIQRAEKRSKR